LGGLAGNAVARDIDCRHHHRYRRVWSEHDHRYYWRRVG
jgi:hypothetical protein